MDYEAAAAVGASSLVTLAAVADSGGGVGAGSGAAVAGSAGRVGRGGCGAEPVGGLTPIEVCGR